MLSIPKTFHKCDAIQFLRNLFHEDPQNQIIQVNSIRTDDLYNVLQYWVENLETPKISETIHKQIVNEATMLRKKTKKYLVFWLFLYNFKLFDQRIQLVVFNRSKLFSTNKHTFKSRLIFFRIKFSAIWIWGWRQCSKQVNWKLKYEKIIIYICFEIFWEMFKIPYLLPLDKWLQLRHYFVYVNIQPFPEVHIFLFPSISSHWVVP